MFPPNLKTVSTSLWCQDPSWSQDGGLIVPRGGGLRKEMSHGESPEKTEAGGKERRENGVREQGDRWQTGKAKSQEFWLGVLGSSQVSLASTVSHHPPPSSSPLLTWAFPPLPLGLGEAAGP